MINHTELRAKQNRVDIDLEDFSWTADNAISQLTKGFMPRIMPSKEDMESSLKKAASIVNEMSYDEMRSHAVDYEIGVDYEIKRSKEVDKIDFKAQEDTYTGGYNVREG